MCQSSATSPRNWCRSPRLQDNPTQIRSGNRRQGRSPPKDQDRSIDIYAWADSTMHSVGDFHLNYAAGLEDSIIGISPGDAPPPSCVEPLIARPIRRARLRVSTEGNCSQTGFDLYKHLDETATIHIISASEIELIQRRCTYMGPSMFALKRQLLQQLKERQISLERRVSANAETRLFSEIAKDDIPSPAPSLQHHQIGPRNRYMLLSPDLVAPEPKYSGPKRVSTATKPLAACFSEPSLSGLSGP